jgi:hypothetical protein
LNLVEKVAHAGGGRPVQVLAEGSADPRFELVELHGCCLLAVGSCPGAPSSSTGAWDVVVI